jgi:hypothetical protein
MGAADITLEATRFITEAISMQEAGHAAASAAHVVSPPAAPTEGSMVPAETLPDAAQLRIAPRPQRGLPMEIRRLREDTQRLLAKAAYAPALSADTPVEGRHEAIRHAAAPASVVEARAVAAGDRTVAVDDGKSDCST